VAGLYLPPMSEGGELEVRKVPKPSGYCTLSLDLEALVLRLLSPDRKQRGTAEALAREAAALAETAGEFADRPIVPTASAKPTDQGGPAWDGLDAEEAPSGRDEPTGPSSSTDPACPRGRRRRLAGVPARPALALAALAGGFLVALVMLPSIVLSRSSEPAPPWIEAPHQAVAPFAPDAGIGEEALSGVQDVLNITTRARVALSRPMPSNAFPGQKKPPCESRYEVSALGACWVVLAAKPPCGSGAYDLDGLCVRAVFPGPRQPTSEEP